MLGRAPQKVIADSAPRQADRAFDDDDILFFAIDIGLLKGGGGVALLGGDKAGRHLNGGGPKRENVVDIRP